MARSIDQGTKVCQNDRELLYPVKLSQWSLIALGTILAASAVLARYQPEHGAYPSPPPERPVSLEAAPEQDVAQGSPSYQLDPPVQADELHCVGIYEGDYGNGPTHSYKFHPTGKALVQVDRPGRTVALVLTAYEPTLWTVRVSPGTRVTDVILSGYHEQTATGLDPDTRVMQSSYDRPGPHHYFYFDTTEPVPEERPSVQRLTGMAPTSLETTYTMPADGVRIGASTR